MHVWVGGAKQYSALTLEIMIITLLSEFSEIIAPVQSQAGDGVCDVCKMMVAYVDRELQKNATSREIQEVLEKVCSELPESYRDQVN